MPTFKKLIEFAPQMKSSESIKIVTQVFNSIDNYHYALNVENKLQYTKNLDYKLTKMSDVSLMDSILEDILKDETIFFKNWESSSELLEDVLAGGTEIKFENDWETISNGTQRLYEKGYGYYYSNNFFMIDDGINKQIIQLGQMDNDGSNINYSNTILTPFDFDFLTGSKIYSIDEFFLGDIKLEIDKRYKQHKNYKFNLKRVIRSTQ